MAAQRAPGEAAAPALLNTLVARPELSSYAARITWVKTQMEHARGLAQATAYGPGPGKDNSGDVLMGSLAQPPCPGPEAQNGALWALHQEKARLEFRGEHGQVESVQAAINALSKGKGGGGKGAGKGPCAPGGARGDPAQTQGKGA